MSDRKLFYEDAALATAATTVVERGTLEGRPWVRLAETIFYPEGGGQPADRGTIGGVEVVDVRSRGAEVLHFLAAPIAEEEVRLELDVERRLDHRQQHTAQHLVTAILQDRHALPTTAFHLGEEYTAIEVAGPPPSLSRLAGFEREIEEEIRRDLPVTTRWVEPEALAAIPVRTRGLPEGHEGKVRLVEIMGIDCNTCGGTHVEKLGEIRLVRFLDASPARGGARIRFLAGGRVGDALTRSLAVERELNARIGTAPAEFVAVIDSWRAERKRLEKRVRALEGELAAFEAAAIAASPEPILVRRLPSADRLSATAQAVLALRPDAVVVLCAEGSFLVRSGPEGPEDVSTLGERLRESLRAKGGGRGRSYQGTGGLSPEDESWIRARLR